jgi:hypothetical protein
MTHPFEEQVSTQKAIITWGLKAWIVLQLFSAPIAGYAREKWNFYVTQGMPQDKLVFNDAAGTYYLVQALAELAMILASIAALVWLYRAWSHAAARLRQPALSPREVVIQTLVPIWGFWRLHGLLLDLAAANHQDESDIRVGRWWWATVAFFLFGALAKSRSIPGIGHIVYDVLGMGVGLLSLNLFRTLQNGLANENTSNTPDSFMARG